METKAPWILGQPIFLILVVATVMTAVVGVRRSGGGTTAHQAGIVGGRSAYGPQQGYAQAGSDLSAWWGVAPGQAGQVTEIVEDPERRSVSVRVRGWMATLLGRQADLGAGSFQRWEDFYTGPPSEFE